MSKIGLPFDLKQKLAQFIIEFGLFLRISALDILFIAHKDLDEHIVIIVVIFCHGHSARDNKTSCSSRLHRLILSICHRPSAGLLHIRASSPLQHLCLLLIDPLLLKFPLLRLLHLHTTTKNSTKCKAYIACWGNSLINGYWGIIMPLGTGSLSSIVSAILGCAPSRASKWTL